MRPCRAAVFLFAVFALALAGAPARASDPDRGRGLYEQRCGACHGQSVHVRAKRRARDYNEVREWVERWAGVLELRWGPEEIEDVAMFLNSTYYGYALPSAGGRAPESRHVVQGNARQ